MKTIALIVLCLTVVSAGVVNNQDLDCEAVAKQIVGALQKQSKPYTNLESKNFVFSDGETTKYDVDVDGISLEGIQFAAIDKVSECKQGGRYSTSMNIKLNLGSPKLTSKVTFKERSEREDTKAKTLDVTAFAASDLALNVQLNYNSQWKKVAPIYVNVATSSYFISFSDCRHDILFCDRLHQRLDSMAWNNVLNQIPIVTKQVLSRLRL